MELLSLRISVQYLLVIMEPPSIILIAMREDVLDVTATFLKGSNSINANVSMLKNQQLLKQEDLRPQMVLSTPRVSPVYCALRLSFKQESRELYLLRTMIVSYLKKCQHAFRILSSYIIQSTRNISDALMRKTRLDLKD